MKALCYKCPAMCCRYIALPLDTPTDQRGFEDARWFLMHEGINIFVSGRQWYVSVATPCKHLTEDGMCGCYESRPKICRVYKDDNCDYHGGDYSYSLFFTHPEQIEQYARKVLARSKAKPKAKQKTAVKCNQKGKAKPAPDSPKPKKSGRSTSRRSTK